MNNKKKYNIAIVGLGTIGSYLYNYLSKNRNLFSSKVNIQVNKIFVSAKNKNKKRKFKVNKKY